MTAKELRVDRGMTQAKLSKLSGVPIRTIQDIEAGNIPRLNTAFKIAAALNMSLDDYAKNILKI